jgi:hypothetical protein
MSQYDWSATKRASEYGRRIFIIISWLKNNPVRKNQTLLQESLVSVPGIQTDPGRIVIRVIFPLEYDCRDWLPLAKNKARRLLLVSLRSQIFLCRFNGILLLTCINIQILMSSHSAKRHNDEAVIGLMFFGIPLEKTIQDETCCSTLTNVFTTRHQACRHATNHINFDVSVVIFIRINNFVVNFWKFVKIMRVLSCTFPSVRSTYFI